MTRVIIAGVSTRAAAESAARAGFDVTALDGFADRDQHPFVRSLSLPRHVGVAFTARAAAAAAKAIDADVVAYLSNFENDPEAVAMLADGRRLWGNPPDVLRRCRDPFHVAAAFGAHGLPTPRVISTNVANDSNVSNDSNDSNESSP
jgi:predicted ATP-grasp superfamily ATP-dependent carboligase